MYILTATHYGAIQFDESGGHVMSGIDMAPTLFGKWGVSFDYLLSDGDVYAANKGYVKRHSKCSVEVVQGSYSTYYSHVVVDDILLDGDKVEQGDHLAKISLLPDDSNCDCDWVSRSFVCSTGPHLHVELRRDGHPETLNNKVMSNYLIKPGQYPHDQFCNDPESCTLARYNGSSCATTYTDITTGEVFCPLTKGQNLGMC